MISADRPDLSPPHTSFLIVHAVPQCQPFPNALLPRMMALRNPQRALVFLLELVSCVSVSIRVQIPLSPSCVVSTRPYSPAMVAIIISSNHKKHHLRAPRASERYYRLASDNSRVMMILDVVPLVGLSLQQIASRTRSVS
jgi:hypothetical protein